VQFKLVDWCNSHCYYDWGTEVHYCSGSRRRLQSEYQSGDQSGDQSEDERQALFESKAALFNVSVYDYTNGGLLTRNGSTPLDSNGGPGVFIFVYGDRRNYGPSPPALPLLPSPPPSPPPPSPPTPPSPPQACEAGNPSHQTLDCDTAAGVFNAVGDTHTCPISGAGGYLEIVGGAITAYSTYTAELQVLVANTGAWTTVESTDCNNGCGNLRTEFSLVANHNHASYPPTSTWRFLMTCTGNCNSNRFVSGNPQLCLRPDGDSMANRPPMTPPSPPPL